MGVDSASSLAKDFTLAVTLPCYRDTAFIPAAVELLENVTYPIENDFVIVIAEDGSDSSEVVGELVLEYANILYFQNNQRLGRGRALREAWKHVNADIYIFMDVDMSTNLFEMNAYSNLIEKVRTDGFDLVTGSRYHPDSRVNRPTLRRFASVGYNMILRLLFGSSISDHQCGFKAFSADLLVKLSNIVESDSWFWDTEITIIAQKKGLKVAEIPVYWTEMKGSRTPFARLLKDLWLHGTGILRLFWRVYFAGV